MSPDHLHKLDLRSRREWRKWLTKNHGAKHGIWLVFHKRHRGRTGMSYDDAVEEALCYGWIDSIIRRIDDDRYVRKFTPRKPDSKWSTINRRRYADLKSRGLLAEPGLKRAPTIRGGDAQRPSTSAVPPYLADALKSVPEAWKHFTQLAPSYKRMYIGWIDSARRVETREKRLREALTLLAEGKRLGLK
jgi:uncharacterized protein YdeI (YjbR/CyaY-like superfamily)